MIKRLPYLALAFLLAISTCVLMGGKVRAASPIFYEGTSQWNIARRITTAPVDFDYTSSEFQVPLYGTGARIIDALGGLPSNATTTITYDRIPAYITVHSPELVANGGKLYIAFVMAYGIGHSVTSTSQITFTSHVNDAKAYRYSGGSPEYAALYGTSLSYQTYVHSGRTTEYSFDVANYNPININATGFQQYNGFNFPKTMYFINGTTFGANNNINQFYVYGDTSVNWYKSNFFQFAIDVPAATVSNTNYTSIYLILNDMLQGTFVSRNANITLNNTYTQETETVQVPAADFFYLCPIYCYAVSNANYDEVEQALQRINSNLSLLLGGQQVSQSVLESYAALGSEARQAAEDAVRAMSAASPTFQASDYDVFDNVDSVAMQQFSSIVGFLSLRRILPILLAALALVTIGYLFFGKK